MMLAAVFYNPMAIRTGWVLYLLIPICAAIALVYKAIRIQDIGRFWREFAVLMLYMLLGLASLGALLWAIHAYWP